MNYEAANNGVRRFQHAWLIDEDIYAYSCGCVIVTWQIESKQQKYELYRTFFPASIVKYKKLASTDQNRLELKL